MGGLRRSLEEREVARLRRVDAARSPAPSDESVVMIGKGGGAKSAPNVHVLHGGRRPEAARMSWIKAWLGMASQTRPSRAGASLEMEEP